MFGAGGERGSWLVEQEQQWARAHHGSVEGRQDRGIGTDRVGEGREVADAGVDLAAPTSTRKSLDTTAGLLLSDRT